MAETVVIDIEAQYRDKTSNGVDSSLAEIERIKKKLEEAEAAAQKAGSTLGKMPPTDEVKNATTEIERMRKKLGETEAAGKKANASMEKIASTASSIAKKTVSIPIKVIDYATKPLRGLLNYATSLKGILTGLVVGQAGQMLISNPLGLADQYSNAFIGFKTLFGSEQRAQQMMNDLDAFARTTPYKTSNVIGQTQKMLAMGWDPNRLISDMTIIGDAAAATGKGDEGLERIVLALAQIKSKGKLSTEELNQLAEAGIGAKAYIAEGLGYGSDDAGMAKMAKDLEGGKIGGNAAVEMLLAGMQRDYAGMMESISKETVEGIKSNIEDTFEINIFRKWGQGLQAGAKVGLGSLADMLDANQERLSAVGDKLQEIGEYLSTKLAGYVEDSIGKAMDIMESADFKNASLGGKAGMLWDAIIAEPFDQWWESDGQAFLGNVAGKIGEGLGKFYNGAITTILGINADGAAEGGVSIGAKFAEGFIQGFDAKKVLESIKNAFANALKIVPGGEEATTSSWISAALLGYGGLKVAGGAKGLLGGFGGLGKAGAGALLNSEKLGMLAINLGAGNLSSTASLSAGALSAIGAGSVAGGAVGGLGLVSGLADLTKAVNTANSDKERNVAGWSAASKFGMVGTGAAAGAALGSFVPVLGTAAGALIGAGVGGLGALFGGGKFGEAVSDYLDSTDKIKAATAAIQETGAALREAADRASELDALSSKYTDLNAKIKDGSLNADDLSQAQGDLSQTIKDLQSLYPGLISQYDIENGRLEEKLQLLHNIAEAERDQARRESEQANRQAEAQLPGLESKITDTQSKQDAALARYNSLSGEATQLSALLSGYAEQDKLAQLYGEDSDQYKAAVAANERRLRGYNAKYGQSLEGYSGVSSNYDYVVREMEKALEKAGSEGEALDDLMAQYQEIYQGKLATALDPESLDAAGGLDSMLQKVSELQAVQQQRLELEKQLAGIEKGSEEYDATARSIQDAETRQRELTASIEPFKEQLVGVLQAVMAINEQFGPLGGTRLSLEDMGLGGLYSYAMPYKQGTTKDQSYWEQVAAHYKKTGQVGGYAGGTLSAVPGLAWVGENGPELVRMRGGEQVYNATDSMRIAEQTAAGRSGGRSRSDGINVSLGGMSINISVGSGGVEDIVAQIRAHLPEIGNDLCNMIATQLSKTFANMPTNAVEGI